MTDLEKINRPITYTTDFCSNILFYKGVIDTNGRRKGIYYFFRERSVFNCIYVHSILNENNPNKIAIFRVTKIHDTRRENS